MIVFWLLSAIAILELLVGVVVPPLTCLRLVRLS
jgi:hypothetical protein